MFNTMTDEQISKAAPSAFAITPYHGQSDRYAFVPTSDIIKVMRENGFQPVSASQSRSRIEDKKNFTKHMIRFRNNDTQLTKVGDSLLDTVLVNSHDGTSRYELSAGIMRLACLNGLMVSEGLISSVKIRHTGDITVKVVESSLSILNQAPMIAEVIQVWRQIQLERQEQLLLAEAAHSLRFEEDSTLAVAITPERLLTVRRYNDNGNDLWSVFNRIQENVIRGGLRGRTEGFRAVRTKAVKGIDNDVRLNKAMWTLAEKMAELKS